MSSLLGFGGIFMGHSAAFFPYSPHFCAYEFEIFATQDCFQIAEDIRSGHSLKLFNDLPPFRVVPCGLDLLTKQKRVGSISPMGTTEGRVSRYMMLYKVCFAGYDV